MPNKWIAEALERTGRKQVELARRLGVSQSVMTKMIHSKRQLRAHEADTIREFLGEDVQSSALRYAKKSPTPEVRLSRENITVPLHAEMPDDVAVLGTALGGSSGGDFTMNGNSGLRVRRPPKLAGRADIFALYVQGESMAPRYMPGELIFLEKGRPPQGGDHVVVEMQPGPDGVQEAYLKRLLSVGPTKVKLEQYNPAKVVEIERARVLQIVRVMTTQDLLGV